MKKLSPEKKKVGKRPSHKTLAGERRDEAFIRSATDVTSKKAAATGEGQGKGEEPSWTVSEGNELRGKLEYAQEEDRKRKNLSNER